MLSASRPWLLLPTERSAAFREARGRVYVEIPSKKALSLYPLGSEVVVDKSGTKLLMTSEREPGKPSTTDIAIALGTAGKTRVEQTASGVRMKAGASGTISFSVPKDGITVHEDGVLLAYDVADSD